jgi:predicted TIM-barrel fold metal-dependent hydrolase
MPVHDDVAPDFRAPAGSCDAHFHVFGPGERYPYSADLRYKPPLAPLEDYLELARHLNIGRYVFVQPSAYGRDNACMLDALRAVGSKCRGIVDIDENIPDAELDRLNGLGVRGVRVNVNPIKPPEPGFSKTMLARIKRLDERCAETGWMLDFLTPGWLTQEREAARFSMLPRFPAQWVHPVLGEAHRRLSHVGHNRFLGRRPDGTRVDGSGSGPAHLGQRLSASFLRR